MANLLVVNVFTANGTWFKPEGLMSVDVIARGSGANGISPYGGTGGDVVVTPRRIVGSDLPASVSVIVGSAGAGSTFGDVLTVAGGSDSLGVGVLAGGVGGAPGADGASTSGSVVRLLAGGGGGGGTGGGGGGSGLVPGVATGVPGVGSPVFWEVCQSGSGGGAGKAGGFPSGGGGAGAAGAAGCVTILEHIFIPD